MTMFIFAAGNDGGQPTLELVKRGMKTETRRSIKPNQYVNRVMENGKQVKALYNISDSGRTTVLRRVGRSYPFNGKYGTKGVGRILLKDIFVQDVRLINTLSVKAEGWISKGHYLGTLVKFHNPTLSRLVLEHATNRCDSKDPQAVAYAFEDLWNSIRYQVVWDESDKRQQFYHYINNMPIELWKVVVYRFETVPTQLPTALA